MLRRSGAARGEAMVLGAWVAMVVLAGTGALAIMGRSTFFD